MLLILIMPVFIPAAQAVVIAPALTYGAIELIAAALIGGGAVYATSEEAREAAGQVFAWLQENAMDAANTFLNMAGGLIGAPELTGVGFRVSSDVWQSITEAFSSLFGNTGDGDLVYGEPYYFADSKSYKDFWNGFDSGLIPYERYIVYAEDLNGNYIKILTPYVENIGDNASYEYNGRVYTYRSSFSAGRVFIKNAYSTYGVSVAVGTPDGLYSYLHDQSVMSFAPPGSLILDTFGSVDLVFPSDNSLVRVPDLPDVQTDEEGKEVVVYPDLSLNPTDHLADIPKQETGEQVDVPYDTLVDVSTGEAVGEGEGTGEGDITDPADPAGTLPKPGDLSLPQLIISKFPFCIPFDVANLIGQLTASAEAPVIRIPVKTIDGIATQYITIDFSQYESLVSIVRWGIYILFVAGLAYATRNYIKW